MKNNNLPLGICSAIFMDKGDSETSIKMLAEFDIKFINKKLKHLKL